MSPKEHDPKPHPKPHAKKHVPPHEKKHEGPGKKKGPGKHLRRAYEHLARVDVLLSSEKADMKLAHSAERARELALHHLKQHESSEEGAKIAAELARATEHIAFAALVSHAAERMQWEGPLQEAYQHEYDELVDDAEAGEKEGGPNNLRDEQEDAQGEITGLIQLLKTEAEEATTKENFPRAIECMRAAEALAEASKHLDHLREELQGA